MVENQWIDISMVLDNEIGTWPGDIPFSYQLSAEKKQGGSAANVGMITTSLHTGTHLDAPFHYDSNGETIDALDVSLLIGTATVVDIGGHATIGRKELEAFDLSGVSRLLLRSFDREDHRFVETFPVLREDIGPFLKEKGIHLLGTDCPSVDPVDSKSMTAHHALHENGVYILENLVLKNVVPDTYQFIALPLSIRGGDGSPVRAVIRAID